MSTVNTLFVRLRRVGPQEPHPANYTIGQTNFEYDHPGWYEVNALFGERLRGKVSNELNPTNSPPMFEVLTREQVQNLERAEERQKEMARENRMRRSSGDRISSAIPVDITGARRVGKLTGSTPEPRRRVVEEPVEKLEPVDGGWDEDPELPEDGDEEGEGVTLVTVEPPAPQRPAPTNIRTAPPRTASGKRIRPTADSSSQGE